MKKVAWVHDDALRRWFGDLHAIYIFDEERLKQERWSLKRIGFIYECLLELPIEIRRGDPVSELSRFEEVVTTDSPDPRLRAMMSKLRTVTQLEIVPQPEFVRLSGRVDLKRFSRYWSKAEKALLAADNL